MRYISKGWRGECYTAGPFSRQKFKSKDMWYERTLSEKTRDPKKAGAIERIKIVDGIVVEAQLHYKDGSVSTVFPGERWTHGDPTKFDCPFKVVEQ